MSSLCQPEVNLSPHITTFPILGFPNPKTAFNECHVRLYSTKPPTSESVPHGWYGVAASIALIETIELEGESVQNSVLAKGFRKVVECW